MKEQDVERIKQIIDEIKPRYTQFGGEVEFVDIEDQKVRIKTEGYCHRWHVTRVSLVEALDEAVKAEFPWVKMVRLA